MNGKKKEKIDGSGSVKILPNIHSQLVNHCKEHGILISYFVTEAVKEKLEKQKSK